MLRDVGNQAFRNVFNVQWSVNTDDGYVEMGRVEGEPVHHLAALIGVVHQHIGLRESGKPVALEWGFTRKERADIAGEIRADVGGVSVCDGDRDIFRCLFRCADHRRMIFRKKDFVSHRLQQLGRTHARAPGHTAFRIFRRGFYPGEVLAHDTLQQVGGCELCNIVSATLHSPVVRSQHRGRSEDHE